MPTYERFSIQITMAAQPKVFASQRKSKVPWDEIGSGPDGAPATRAMAIIKEMI